MLRRLRFTTAIFALILGLGTAQAQSLRNSDGPAEVPPASFTGKQYVDSQGCVFVRAGYAGTVTWVPRVSRKRTVLCGFTPTFAQAPAAEPEPRVAAVTPPPAIPAPKPAMAPIPAPVRTVFATPAPATPAPIRRHVVAAPAPARLPSPTAIAAPGHYSGGAESVTRLPPAPRIAPPEGYRAAFSDDRLNPRRGEQTAEGYAQSALIWTNTVPRRLIDQRSGRDVTRLFPWLRFPFTSRRSMEQQIAYHPNTGYSAKNLPAAANAAASTVLSTKTVAPPRAIAAPAPNRVVAAPAPSRSAVPAGHRFVQIGVFGKPANAQNSAARLQAMGLPVRIGSYQKAGKTYGIVLAGPFGNAAQLRAGLATARRAGFSDAYTRK